jgi:hypothetical protein
MRSALMELHVFAAIQASMKVAKESQRCSWVSVSPEHLEMKLVEPLVSVPLEPGWLRSMKSRRNLIWRGGAGG